VYGVGVYTTQPTEQTLANFTTSNRLQNLTTSGHLPEMTGYTFQGFYTGKAGSGTQVINASGVIQYDAASTQITSDESPNNTATWYAHWLAQTINITYSCGTAPSGASTGTTPGITGSAPAGASNVAFDSQYTLPSTPNTCALAGYHFKGWSCNYAIGTGTENSGYAAGSNTSALTYTATVTNNVGTIASGTSINAIKATSNVTCDAIWEANTVALTWDANGGSGATGGGGNCTYDGDITLPTAPTRNGYTFKGWTVCPGAHATAGSVVNGVCVNTACETGYHVDQTTHTCVVD
jgi:hypothetical protein